MDVKKVNVSKINVGVLAYLGDTIYENSVRRFLINQNISKVNDLQKAAVKYVSAINQSRFLINMLSNNFFSEEEINVIKRARNYKSKSHPKNCDIVTYKYATALEALIGYLSLLDKQDRIKEIMGYIFYEQAC